MLYGHVIYHPWEISKVFGLSEQETVKEPVELAVKARCTADDIDLYLYNESNSAKTYENILKLFDDQELGYQADDFRRCIVSLVANKYKTNITNRVFSTRLAAGIKYAVAYSRLTVAELNEQGIYSNLHEKSVYDALGNKLGTVLFDYGVVKRISVKLPYFDIFLEEQGYIDEGDMTLFSLFQQKDKYGNVLSKTPIKNIAYAIAPATIGFALDMAEYRNPQDVTDRASMLEWDLYQSIEEVIAAHPNKNYAGVLGKKYYIVDDEHLDELWQEFMAWDDFIAFDTETSGLRITFKSRTGEADQLVGVVLCKEEGVSYYFPLQHKAIKNLCGGDVSYFMIKYMKPLLETKKIVTHNANFDWRVAYIYGINTNIVFDTMYAFGVTKRYEIEDFALGLKELTRVIFGVDMFELEDFVRGDWGESKVRFWDLPYEFVRRYAPADADFTLSLCHYVQKVKLLQQYGAERVFKLEVDFAKVVAYSEFWGYHFDIENIPTMRKEILENLDKAKKKMIEIVGHDFNPGSSKQLAEIMYHELGIEKVDNSESTKKEILKVLLEKEDDNGEPMYPFVKYLKDYRDNEGIYSHFLMRLDKKECEKKKLDLVSTPDGFISPEVLQVGTTTGRVSIKNPNYQSYNDTIKKHIVPRPGFIMGDSDFSQIEYRVLASMAHQENLMEALSDPDLDYHTYQAARMFGVPYASVTKALRKQAKGINFGLPYGMEDPSLGARVFGQRTPENTRKAAKLRKLYFQGQERILEFFERVRAEGVREGYTSTLYGRRRYYYKGKFSKSAIRRQAGNHVIQGTAADIYKQAVVNLFKRICKEGWLGKVLFDAFIHDELLFEVHKSIDMKKFIKVWREEYQIQIEGFCKIFAGLGFGNSWYQAKSDELSPQYIDYVIENHYNDGNWNENLQEFRDWLYEEQEQFDIRRVKAYLTAPENQGQVIKPNFGTLVQELVFSALSDREDAEDLRVSVGYEPSSDKVKYKKPEHYTKIQSNLMLFCQLYGLDYTTIDIRNPEDVYQESASNETNADTVVDEETGMSYVDVVCLTMNGAGCMIDSDRNCMYIDNYDLMFTQQIIASNCVAMASVDDPIPDGAFHLYVRMNPGADGKTSQFMLMPYYVDVSQVEQLRQVLYMYRLQVKS